MSAIQNTLESVRERLTQSTRTVPEAALADDSEYYDILRNERRRRIINYVHVHNATTIGELAEHLAAIENDKEPSELLAQERKRVYIGLYQEHLPRLDDAGAIHYTQDRGTVEATERTSAFCAAMVSIHQHGGDA